MSKNNPIDDFAFEIIASTSTQHTVSLLEKAAQTFSPRDQEELATNLAYFLNMLCYAAAKDMDEARKEIDVQWQERLVAMAAFVKQQAPTLYVVNVLSSQEALRQWLDTPAPQKPAPAAPARKPKP